MSAGTDDKSRVCCQHCGSAKLRLSYRQYGQDRGGRPGPGGTGRASTSITLIMRCLKCDRFTPTTA